MPQSYAQLREGYELAKSQGYDFADLPSYVRYLVGDNPALAQEYHAGATDGWIKGANYRLNQVAESTGLNFLGGEFGQWLGGKLGAPEAGRAAGAKLGRGVANLLPLLLTGGSSLPVQAAGALASGGLAGADVYGEGGTAGQAFTTGVLTAALPVFAKAGTNLGLYLSGAPKVAGIATEATTGLLGKGVAAGANVAQRLPQNFAQRLGGYLGGQTAATVPFGIMESVEARMNGQESPVGSKEWWVGTIVGQIPFMVGDVPALIRKGPNAAAVQNTLTNRIVPPQVDVQPTVPKAAVPQDPAAVARGDALLESLKARTEIAGRQDLDAGQKSILLQALDAKQNAALKQPAKETVKTQLGTSMQLKTDEVTFVGDVVHQTDTGTDPDSQGVYFVKVNIANKLDYAGKIMMVPKKVAKVNADGSITVPTRFTAESTREQIDPLMNVPELPAQEQPGQVTFPPKQGELGRPGELPVRPEGDPDWTAPVPELEAKINEAKAKQAALKSVVDTTPPTPPTTLEETKAQLVAIDSINDQLDNVKQPISDDQLKQDIAAQVSKGENLTDANTVVVQSHKAKALDKVEAKQVKLTREQRKLMRQVEVATAFGQIEENVRAATAADQRIPESDELRIINDALIRHGDKMGGRMMEFSDELKSAYIRWREKVKPTLPEGQLEKSLGALIKTVLRRHETGKVITGGKVLRADGKWSEKGGKGSTKLFDTREQAEAEVLVQKSDNSGLQNPKVMTRKTAAGEKFYLMERPREQSLSIDPGLDQSRMGFDGEKVVELPAHPNDSPVIVPKMEQVKDTIQEQFLALSHQDVRDAVAEVGEIVTPDFIEKAPARLAVLSKAILDGTLPAARWGKEQEIKYNTLLEKQGLEFPDVDQATDFAMGDLVDVLRQRVSENVKQGVSPAPGWDAVDTGLTLTPAEQTRIAQLEATDPVRFLSGMSDRHADDSFAGNMARILLDYKDQLAGVKINIIPGSSNAKYIRSSNSIEIGSGRLRTNDAIEFALPHELAHALSVKLLVENPNHPAVKELDALRQTAINALPKEIRALVDRAVSEDLLSKHARGEETNWGVEKDDAWYHVIYGLTNNLEFVAQTFSSPNFQGYLASVPHKQKTSLIRTITNAIAKLFGYRDPQKFATLLEASVLASNRAFDAQRSMVHFEQIAKTALLENGMLPRQAARRIQAMWNLATTNPLGDTQEQSRQYVNAIAENYLLDRDAKLLTPLEEQAATLATKGWESMPEEARQDQIALLTEIGAITGNVPAEQSFTRVADLKDLPTEFWANLHPASVRNLESYARYGDLQLSILFDQELAAQQGLINVRPAQNLPAIDAARAKFQTILREVRKAHRDQEEFSGFARMTSDGFLQTVFDGETNPAPDSPELNDVLGEPEKLGAFTRNFKPVWQVAMDHPEMKPAIGALFDYRAQIEQNRNRVFSHFSMEVNPDGTATWNEKTQERTEKFMSRPDLVRRVDDILRLRQDKRDFLDSNDPKDKAALDGVLRGLSSDDRTAVLSMADKQARSTMEGQELVVETNAQLETTTLAMMLQKGSPNGVRQNRALANQLMEGVSLLSDPAQQAAGTQMIMAVRQQLTPELFNTALQYASNATKRVAQLKDFFSQREWFATEQSFDQFHVSGRKANGEMVRGFGKTMKEAEDMVKKGNPGVKIIKRVDKEDKNDPNRTYGAPKQMLEVADRLDGERLQQAVAAGMDQVTIQQLQEMSFGAALRRELAASQLYKPGSERAGVAGREYLPMLANHFNYHTALIRSLQNRVVRAEVELATMNPDIAAQPAKVALVKQALTNFLQPDSQAMASVAKGITTYNLAYSLANMAVEGTQALTTHAAQLTAEGAGIIGGLQRLGAATKEIATWAKTGKWKNEEHERFFKQFTQDLEVGYGAWDDQTVSSERTLERAKALHNGDKPKGVADYVKGAVGAYGRLGMNLYGIMTHFNARLSVAAFDFYRSKGMDFDSAYQKAREFNRTVNFSGGKAARPVGFFSNQGGWRGASQFMYIFRGFTLGMWSTLGRHIRTGFSSKSQGSYSERMNSRKAAVQMLTTMFVMGGALGLPGVEAAIAVLEDTTDLKLKQGIREGVASVLGDSTLAEGFLMGTPNMLGVDAHSRVSLGGFPGLSSFEGFSLTDLAGPGVGLVERLYTGAKKTLTGQFSDAASYSLPPAFRRLADVIKSDSVMTPSGKLLTTLTPGEKVAMAVGFTPTRVSQMKEAERIRVRSEKIDNAETGRSTQRIADALTTGNIHEAKALLLQDLRDPKEKVRAIAKAVEDRTFPSELLDKPGTNQVGLAAAFGQQHSRVSELARLQLRQSVYQRLGLPVQVSPRDLQKAQMVDQVLSQNPTMTRQAARQKVEDLMGTSI